MTEERMTDKEYEARYDCYVRDLPQAAGERLMMHFIAERHALEAAIQHDKDLARSVALMLLPHTPGGEHLQGDALLMAAEELINDAQDALELAIAETTPPKLRLVKP